MPDNSFVVRAVVDIAQATSAMDEFTQGNVDAINKVTVAFEQASPRMATAMRKISDDTRVAAASVEDSWKRLVTAQQAVGAATGAVVAATKFQRAASGKGDIEAETAATSVLAETVKELTLAKQAAAEAAVGLTGTQVAENAAVDEGGAANIRARLTTDMLTGQFARADQSLIRFASHTSMIGPLIEAAFVPFAVAAFAEIIFRAAEKVYELYENVILLKSSIQELEKADATAAEKAASLNYEYEESLARRLEAQGKLKEATAEFAKAASDKPLEVIKIDDKNFKQFNSEFVTFLQAVHTTADAPTVISRIQAEADSATKQLKEAKKLRDELADVTANGAMDFGHDTGSGAGNVVALERQDKLITDLTEKISLLHNAASQVQSETGIAAEAAAARAAQNDKKGNKEKAPKDTRLEEWRTELQGMRDAEDGFHELSKADEAKFWESKLEIAKGDAKLYGEVYHQMREDERAAQKESLKDEETAVAARVAATKQGSAERVAILQEEVNHLKSIGAGETSDFKRAQTELAAAVKAYTEQQGKDVVEQERRKVDATRKSSEERAAAERAVLSEMASLHLQETSEYSAQMQRITDAERAAAAERVKLQELDIEQARITGLAKIQLERQNVQTEYDLHLTNAQQHISALKELDDREYEIAKTAIEKKLALALQDPLTSPVRIKELQNKIVNLTREFNDKIAALNTQGVKDSMQKYDQFFSHVTSGFQTAINGWLQGTQTFGRAMAGLWNSMAMAYIESLEKMLVAHLQHEVAKLAAHTAEAQAEVGVTAATEGQKDTIGILADLESIGRAAAAAAAHAFKWVMQAVPFPLNVVLAPAAAAATFAKVIAFQGLASAAGGMEVPQDMLAQVHKNEMVLPASLSQGFKSIIGSMGPAGAPGSAGGPGGSGAAGAGSLTHNHHYNVTVNAGSDRGEMLSMVEDALVPMIRSASRRGLLPST